MLYDSIGVTSEQMLVWHETGTALYLKLAQSAAAAGSAHLGSHEVALADKAASTACLLTVALAEGCRRRPQLKRHISYTAGININVSAYSLQRLQYQTTYHPCNIALAWSGECRSACAMMEAIHSCHGLAK